MLQFTWIFLSTLSLRRATAGNRTGLNSTRFLSTLSLRRATYARLFQLFQHQISIHALLAESDILRSMLAKSLVNFYPRSPCGERQMLGRCSAKLQKFLSTLSLRRATARGWIADSANRNFYPRSPCGERRNPASAAAFHAKNFYPRSPCGERRQTYFPLPNPSNFYPRSPCGERPWNPAGKVERKSFLSTLSLRRATSGFGTSRPSRRYFYPRSPCGERPNNHGNHVFGQKNFYPRSPCGERLIVCRQIILFDLFLSTLSLRRATLWHFPKVC